MRRTAVALLLLLLLCLSWPLLAAAQTPSPASAAAMGAMEAAPTLEPFVASYQVFKGGKQLGEATMQAVRQQDPRWRVDLVMRGTRGLFGVAGINAEQSSVFDLVDGAYRPITQATVNKSIFTRRQTVGIYDWASQSARWQGDVKNDYRRGPHALQRGDMTGLLINLAIIRDAAPGQTLSYRFVDDGRTREHVYRVADTTENIKVGGLGYNAMKVSRLDGDNEETTIWVAKNVPTPIRMLQRENGQDTYDLRLVEYKGVD